MYTGPPLPSDGKGTSDCEHKMFPFPGTTPTLEGRKDVVVGEGRRSGRRLPRLYVYVSPVERLKSPLLTYQSTLYHPLVFYSNGTSKRPNKTHYYVSQVILYTPFHSRPYLRAPRHHSVLDKNGFLIMKLDYIILSLIKD